MEVTHPYAGEGDGVPPAQVDVDGESVTVDGDGTFEVDSESWLQRFADRHDVDPTTLVDGQDASGDNADGVGDETVADPPLDPAEFSVDSLRDALQDADYDAAELDAVAEAEAAGKDRKTAHEAIDAAREE